MTAGAWLMNLATGMFAGKSLPRNARAVLRADDDFLSRKMDFVCGRIMGGDFRRAFIWNTICVLNVRHLTQGADTARYAALFDFPPDEERIPVNIRKLAQALLLPYETVRRQVLLLERDGLCVRVPGKGIFVPTRIFRHPDHVEGTKLVIAAVQRLIADLKRAGFDFSQFARSPRAGLADPTPIARAVVRLDAGYTLDVIAIIRAPHDDDPVEAVIFTAIATENTRHLSPADHAAADAPAPDALRRPVSVLAVATSLNIPYETLRRMFARMVRSGRLARVKDGFIVPQAAQRRIETDDVLRRRHARLVRFLADLQYTGMAMPA